MVTRRIACTLGIWAAGVLGGHLVLAGQTRPAPAQLPPDYPLWASPGNPDAPAAPDPPVQRPTPPPFVEDGPLVRIPGSSVGHTQSQLRGVTGIPDWYPEEHGPMPEVVARGKDSLRPLVWHGGACGFCHVANGRGRPENAPPAGLPVAYILQQMDDFKNGLRRSADPRKGNTILMIEFAKGLTDEETRAAAEYFARQPYPQWIRVVETDTVPKMRSAGMFMPIEGPGAGSEPIGQRIIETPEDPHLAELRDGHSGFVAYVPVGSIKRGELLVQRGLCGFCHGADLGGLGPVPPLAGRSPSYTARQLYDFKAGTRRGAWSPLMKRVVASMTSDDMLNISAYLASRTPPEGRTGSAASSR